MPGTLAGGWFMSPYDGSDPYRPTDWVLVASLGGDGYLDINGPGVTLRVASSDPTFVPPWEVTGEHCFQHYQSPGRWVYVAVQPGGMLAAAFGDGVCPASLPETHEVFHR